MQLYAIDYSHTARRAFERHTADLPPVPEGYTRLLAADWAHLDEHENTAPEPNEDGTLPLVLVRRLLRPGVAVEYQRRADEWAASQPVPVKTYSEGEYIAAVQSALDSAAQAHGYDSIISACSYAGADNPFRAEGEAFVAWRGNIWAACYAAAGNPPAVPPTPAEFVAALLALVPAP